MPFLWMRTHLEPHLKELGIISTIHVHEMKEGNYRIIHIDWAFVLKKKYKGYIFVCAYKRVWKYIHQTSLRVGFEEED